MSKEKGSGNKLIELRTIERTRPHRAPDRRIDAIEVVEVKMLRILGRTIWRKENFKELRRI